MATSAEPIEVPGESESDDRSTRRMLTVLLLFLGIASLVLLGLLIWLLWPKPAATPPGQAAGYPIHVVATIYGFGTQPDELLKTPLGVTFDAAGNVWISDTGQSRVEEYKPDGSYVQTMGAEDGPGKLYAPYGIAVDSGSDRVYVADFGARTVQVYTTSGRYITHFPADDQKLKVFGPDGFSPYDVQIVGSRVVVSSNDGLYFFDTEGHVVARWGGSIGKKSLRGAGLSMFNFPDSFVSDPKTGRIYVADTMNRRIVALDSAGNWLWVSGRPDVAGKIKGFWQLPRGIQIGPDGNLYIVDTFRPDQKGIGTGHIVVLSPDGQLLSEFGRTGSEDGAFEFPEQLALNSGKTMWAIADRENNRVVLFTIDTLLPKPDDLETPKYEKMVIRPENVWSTPQPVTSG